MQGVDAAALEAALGRLRETMLESVKIAASRCDLEEMEYRDHFFYGALGLLRSSGAVDLGEYKALSAAWDAEFERLRNAVLERKGGAPG